MKFPVFNRRDLIKSGTSAIIAAGFTHKAYAEPHSANVNPGAVRPFKMDQGFEDFTSYFRIISDFGGGTTYRFHSGQALLVPAPGQLAIEFVNFVAIKQDRTRRLPNGDFHHAYKGVTLFTDIESGDVLETFENPVTGKQNTVQPFATSGGSIVYTPNGAYPLKPGADPLIEPKIGMAAPHFQWGSAGEHTWLTYPERFGFYDSEGALVGADNSMYRYMARLEDLQDTKVTNVPSSMSWSSETGMWPWMDMEDHPGHFIFGSLGRKYNRLDAVPARYVEASEKLYPGHLTSEMQWSDFIIPHAMR